VKILAAKTHCKYFLKIAEVTHFHSGEVSDLISREIWFEFLLVIRYPGWALSQFSLIICNFKIGHDCFPRPS
jgi:hypothetical protein